MTRILGLDVGTERIGVAVSDPFGWTAQGVEVIKHRSRTQDQARILHWAEYYRANTLVVGWPRNMDGSSGFKAQWTQEYAAELKARRPQLRIVLWDERLSTVQAERSLLEGNVRRAKRRLIIDKMAAAVILQSYLDSLSRKE